MKKLFLICMLVFTGITGNLIAQVTITTAPLSRSKTDNLFNFAGPFSHRFIIQLKNGNAVTVQLFDYQQFQRLMNLDSIIKKATEDIMPLKDSLSNELTNKRIDHLTDPLGRIKIRYIEFPQHGNSYVQLKGDLTPMKIEQDTLFILGYDMRPGPNKPMAIATWLQYKITVLVNNISELESLADGTLNMAMNKFNEQWNSNTRFLSGKRQLNLYGYYYAPDPTKSISLRNTSAVQKKISLSPYVQVGLQNVNNLLTTSIGAGASLNIVQRLNYKMRLQLFWEPYFFFDKRTDGHFKMRRNDFVTLQLMQESRSVNINTGIEFHSNLSIGYLFHGSGNYFYDHTIKLSTPGIKYKFLYLYPEFIFNDLFKNFQPGLKLMLDLD